MQILDNLELTQVPMASESAHWGRTAGLGFSFRGASLGIPGDTCAMASVPGELMSNQGYSGVATFLAMPMA